MIYVLLIAAVAATIRLVNICFVCYLLFTHQLWNNKSLHYEHFYHNF